MGLRGRRKADVDEMYFVRLQRSDGKSVDQKGSHAGQSWQRRHERHRHALHVACALQVSALFVANLRNAGGEGDLPGVGFDQLE